MQKLETMEPKEKAKELIEKYSMYVECSNKLMIERAKLCASIAVDEVLKNNIEFDSACEHENPLDDYYECYWKEVKQEIENY